MGTRGLLGLIVRGKRRGTYNQFDSYPEGLGAAIAEFLATLTEEERLLRLSVSIRSIEWVSMEDEATPDAIARYRAEEFDYPYTQKDEDTRDMFLRQRASQDRFDPTTWHRLLMGVQGARLLQPVLEGRLCHLADSTGSEEDRTFCEYVYWVDFENQRFVMEGQGREWTFEEMKEEGSFWAEHVAQKKERDARFKEYEEKSRIEYLEWVQRGADVKEFACGGVNFGRKKGGDSETGAKEGNAEEAKAEEDEKECAAATQG